MATTRVFSTSDRRAALVLLMVTTASMALSCVPHGTSSQAAPAFTSPGCRDTVWGTSVLESERVSYELTVRPNDAGVVGVVYERSTGMRIANASIELFARDTIRVASDASGGFQLQRPPSGDYILIVRQYGYGYHREHVTIRDNQVVVLFAGLQGEVC